VESCRGRIRDTRGARSDGEHRDLVVRLQKIKLISRMRGAGEGKRSLIEDNMSRDEDPIGGKIQTPISFVVRRIAKKDAESGAWGELVWSSSGEIGVAGTTKHSKVVI